jgi:hypothetical protein
MKNVLHASTGLAPPASDFRVRTAKFWRRVLQRVAVELRLDAPPCANAEDRIFKRHNSCRWCDSTERQMSDNLFQMQWPEKLRP